MGERVADSFGYLVMIVAVLATIALGMSYVMLGDRANDMFMNTVQDTYADFNFGMISDIVRTDYMEMTGASALSILYENQRVIYDVYDCRTKITKEYDSKGETKSITHLSNFGSNTALAENTTAFTEQGLKFQEGLVYLNQNLHKTIKMSVKQNSKYTDYFDVYLHDMECGSTDTFHTDYCKNSCGSEKHTGECTGTVKHPEWD